MNKYDELREIFQAGLARVNPYSMIQNSLKLEKNILNIKTEQISKTVNLDDFNRIIVLGSGKASARMALALEQILGEKITESLVAVKYGHVENLKKINLVESGHPVPDTKSIEAGKEILRLTGEADDKTLIINLISGGGSSILAVPLSIEEHGIDLSLDDIQITTRLLLSCGAEIQEINCIRKHLSLIKGGRLVQKAYPATSINFILSDVVGDSPDAIASGMSAPDSTTFGNTMEVIRKYALADRLPKMVMKTLELGVAGLISETPKQNDKIFEKVSNLIIGSNYSAVLAAGQKARQLGYNTVLLSSRMTGESSDLASVYFDIAKDIKIYDLLVKKPACLIAGGESTVVLKGDGKGGRNQEMALAFLICLDEAPGECEGIYFLSSATDGNDGPTDAAGGFASVDVLNNSRIKGLELKRYLQNNDSYSFLEACGYLYKTGPTNTNVCDLQIIIIV